MRGICGGLRCVGMFPNNDSGLLPQTHAHCLKILRLEFSSLSFSESGQKREANQNQRNVLSLCRSLWANRTVSQEECGSLLIG